ncbi:peptidoglycan DD-metalloendopeptidase family protein [Nocardia sp. CDC153]|uniref:M23 family metallopeptidase n=1 Tax=Nocardia sp. CDC153 TaxID=3112167 RepID=UPI002DBB8CBE|nr:peptidoglycan DD-metalloendopeptidase family protein [Nocardia sp. CDC153]MEC3951759.1 peptidoglycan DD-metalloendopeptidase family protein [Nocardia sp. CDC153]
MSDGPFPSQHRPRRGHRYREEAENYGGATTFDAPYSAATAVAHGEWGATQSWNSEQAWNSDADWNGGQQWGEPQQQWDESAWQSEQSWNDPQQSWADSQQSWDDPNAQTTANGWAAPNPSDWAAQSRTNWDPTADPTPSDEYRPVYTFKTASGEKLQFSGDGARVNRAAREADSADEERPTRSGGKRRAGGTHRLPAPPTALKGRAAVVAVAAGAVVAAGQATIEASAHDTSNVDYQAANQVKEVAATSVVGGDGSTGSPQVVSPTAPASLDQFNDILEKGKQFAADMANQEASKYRPLWTKFANGTFTSGFGIRWGVAHQGVDIAAPIGTPIYAVADGTVLEAGPASGFGMWVRLLHDDGTVTIYGHIDTATVSQGQRVLAGDQIATVGNRGFSTGPHCHFEVWLNGVDKIDPLPWLASRGISLGPERD